jgi:hypothetical protein
MLTEREKRRVCRKAAQSSNSTPRLIRRGVESPNGDRMEAFVYFRIPGTYGAINTGISCSFITNNHAEEPVGGVVVGGRWLRW